MEVDFNFHNKLIFGKHILEAARSEGLIPLEQYSEQQSTAEDGTWDKILQSNISQQKRHLMSIISADAANCYGRIHHTIVALVFHSLCITSGTIAAMLRPIQVMKFFVRTGWRESSRFFGVDVMRILHGMCQGNGAALATWLVLRTVLVRVFKSLGFGTKI